MRSCARALVRSCARALVRSEVSDNERYRSIVKLLFTDCKEYRLSRTKKSASWKFKCLLDKGEVWEPSLKDKAATSTSRRSKYIRVHHPRVWAEFIVPISPHVRGRMVDGQYIPLRSFKNAFGTHWKYAKVVAKDRRPTALGKTSSFDDFVADLDPSYRVATPSRINRIICSAKALILQKMKVLLARSLPLARSLLAPRSLARSHARTHARTHALTHECVHD